MSLTFHWFLPTYGDSRYIVGGGHGLPAGAAGGSRPATLAYLGQIARSAEQLGFVGVLTPAGAWCEDAWLTTAMLAEVTESMKFLVAFRPGLLSPTLAAQMSATYQRHSGGRLLLNVVVGGGGATLPQLFRLLVELAEADSNLSQVLRAHFAFVEGRLNHPDPLTHKFWFPRIVEGILFGAAMSERMEAAGSNTKLSKEGDEWVLNGEKYYCTGTIYADWIAASAADGEDRISIAFPADLPGVVREDDWDGFGQRLTGSGTTKFHGVSIAPEHIIRRFSDGDSDFDSYIKAFYQLVLLSTLAGVARAVVREATTFVQGRTRAFGVPGTSSPRADPLVQRVVGRLASLSFAADSIVDGAATALEDLYQARLREEADEGTHVATEIKAFQAQQTVISLVLESTTLLFEVGGASATSAARAFDRHWRNARTVASHNPAIYRERAIGDYLLNGTVPDAAWRAAFDRKLAAADDPSAAPAPADVQTAIFNAIDGAPSMQPT